MIQPALDLSVDVLFVVLWPDRLIEPAESGEIAAGCRADDPVIQGHQVRRERAAAGVARSPDAIADDVRAALEIIDAAHAIPNEKARELDAREPAAQAEQMMLLGRAIGGLRFA